MEYMNIDSMHIGSTLKQLREQKGKTIAEASDEIGISQSAIGMYESGKRIPRDEIKIQLARYYGLTVEAIFYPQKQHELCDFGPVDSGIANALLGGRTLPDPLEFHHV